MLNFKSITTYLKLAPYLIMVGVIVYLSIMNIELKADLMLKNEKIHSLKINGTNLENALIQHEQECQARIFEAENEIDWLDTVDEIESIQDNDINTTKPKIIKPGEYTL